MAIDLDMSQFHEIFFDESREGLEAMESGLLNLDVGIPDPEVVNNVFRAAHSIKGAAGTFGFTDIGQFTHVLESILDDVRARKRGVTQEMVDVLLQSVDGLRYMLDCAKSGKQYDKSRIEDLIKKLENLPEEEQQKNLAGWQIRFKPHSHLFLTGNDPYRIFRELREFGEMKITPDTSQLPGINEKDFDPENCYLSWDLLLQSDASLEQIRDIFAWVEGDCDLEISLHGERRKKVERRRRREDDIEKAGEISEKGQEQTSIRVNIDKIDNLINLVGELVITQSTLSCAIAEQDRERASKLGEIVELLERNTWELQEQAMRIRMLSIDFTFQRLPRLVRDLCRTLGKQADLEISGATTEVDKTVLEKIADPLVHLIRNAIDHGIETPEQRKSMGKPESGLIEISACQEGGNIIIQIKDDGAGIDPGKVLTKARENGLISGTEELSMSQIHNLIFLPGFSTASSVSDVSGRGVGMDVVKRNINDLGGNVDVASLQGKGSTFTIKLPLTLAILDGQLVRIGEEVLIIPVLSIVESTQIRTSLLSKVAGKTEVYRFRDEYIPIVRLHDVYGMPSDIKDITDGLLIVVDTGQQLAGLLTDEILSQQQVVIKSLEANFHQVTGLAGATVLGDGTVAMIVDVPGLMNHHKTLAAVRAAANMAQLP